jgi:hypothetical protein
MLKRTYSNKLNQPSQKRLQNIKDKKKITQMMLSVFMDIWMERPHKSEVSGRWLGQEALTTFFHHILPKSKCPEGIFDKDNIILLTFDEHQKVEQDPTFYEEVNKRRLKLKERYEGT